MAATRADGMQSLNRRHLSDAAGSGLFDAYWHLFVTLEKMGAKSPEVVLFPFIGTQVVTPWLRGSGEIHSLYFCVMPGTE